MTQSDPSGDSPTLVRLKASEPLDMQELVADLVATLSPRFQGLRRLGQGGMGLVYVAREPLLKRDVAIKILAPEFRGDVGARERFQREAQAAAAVAHPNVVNIFQVGELNTTRLPYFVMQFVEGKTVEQAYPRGTAAPESVARRIVVEVAAALAAAHARGLVHRDIKPANVMLDPETGRAIVLDFGISASVQHEPADEKLTATGVYIGTPRYMSPEQASGEASTEKSDVYSLGCMAYELLSGQPVFEAKGTIALLAAHMRDTPKPLGEARPGVDRELAALVMRCLEKDPAKRLEAQELSRRLSPGGGALLEWPPPGIEPLHRALAKVSRPFWIGSALLLAVTVTMTLGGKNLQQSGESFGSIAPLLVSGLAIAILLLALVRCIRLGRAASTAVRGGYSWLAVFETVADPDGQTGALITGSGRFAELAPAERGIFRRLRLRRASAIFLGGALPLPALLVVLGLASTFGYSYRAIAVVLLVPLIAMFVAWHAIWRERTRAPQLRQQVPVPASQEAARLAPLWFASFDDAQAGQGIGRGAKLSPSFGTLSAAGVSIATTLIAVTLIVLAMVPVFGAQIFRASLGQYTAVEGKAVVAELARPWALARTSSLTAAEAGTLFYALQEEHTKSFAPYRELPRASRPLPPWTDKPVSAALFKMAPRDTTTNWNGPDRLKVLEAVRAGVSADEVAYLQLVASASLWRDWDALARAKTMDVFGTSIELPFPKAATFATLPVPRLGSIRRLAHASVSRAAYFLARQQLDSADAALRSTISVGLLLADNSNTVLERLVGIVITNVGRDGLTRLYSLTGNPVGPRMKARYDSLIIVRDAKQEVVELETVRSASLSLPQARKQVFNLANARTSHRSSRFVSLELLQLSSCSNVREIVFGPDPDFDWLFSGHVTKSPDSARTPLSSTSSRPQRQDHRTVPLCRGR